MRAERSWENTVQKRFLPAALVLALSLNTTEAKAGIIKEIGDVLAILTVITIVGGGTLEVLTVAATYKNVRSAQRHQEPSAGWIGVGAVGGVTNLVVGGAVIAASLPERVKEPCPTNEPQPEWRCFKEIPMSTTGIVLGTLFLGVGVLALGSAGWAIKNSPDGSPSTSVPGPGSTPAMIGISLPPMRF